MTFAGFAQESEIPPRYKPKHSEFIEMEKCFHIMGIRINKIHDNVISIDFKFNKVLDVQTLNSDTIIINNTPIDVNCLKYGKEGNAFRIFFEYQQEDISIKLDGLLSETGEPLPEIVVEHGIPCAVYDFRSRTWQKY